MPEVGAERALLWTEAIVAVGGMVFVVAIVAIIAMQVGATWRARMLAAREDAYRDLADRVTRVQEQTAQQLEAALAELSEVRAQTGELRRLLREVEEPWAR